MRANYTVIFAFFVFLAFPVWAPEAIGFEGINEPNQNNEGHCSSLSCHPAFIDDYNVTHDSHIDGDSPITTNCDLCHNGSEDNSILIFWSAYNNDKGYGCTGCHGRDYNEYVIRDYPGFPVAGKYKASGWGLRRVHELNGVNKCFVCHGDKEPLPENVSPPYYVDYYSEVNFTDSCRDGLDNDGDGFYDEEDPDCGADTEILHSDGPDVENNYLKKNRLATNSVVNGT